MLKILNMVFYRMKKNKSTLIIMFLTLLLTYICIVDSEMGESIYDRIITCSTNGNWALLFTFFSVFLANSFYKNKYVKNLMGIKNILPKLSFVFGILSLLYIALNIAINILLAILYTYGAKLNIPIGIGSSELINLLIIIFEFSIINFAIGIVIILFENVFSGFIVGFAWWLIIDYMILNNNVVSNIIIYTFILVICILTSLFALPKKELK